MKRTLQLLPWTLGIIRMDFEEEIPAVVMKEPFYSITQSDSEVSIVTTYGLLKEMEQDLVPWRVFRFKGVLDFSLTGILADISDVLRGAKVSIFALSTHDTDYILVRVDQLDHALNSLKENYKIEIV